MAGAILCPQCPDRTRLVLNGKTAHISCGVVDLNVAHGKWITFTACSSLLFSCHLHRPALLASTRPRRIASTDDFHATMDLPVNASLTLADKIVLDNLRSSKPSSAQDAKTVSLLDEQNSVASADFLPTVFTTFPEPPALNRAWRAYTACASRIVRRPTDIGVLFVSPKWLDVEKADGGISNAIDHEHLHTRSLPQPHPALPRDLAAQRTLALP